MLAQFYWLHPDPFDSRITVLERDNYTCRDCGYQPSPKKVSIAYCGKCAELGFLFKPVKEWGMLRPDFANYPPTTFTPVTCKFSDAKRCVDCGFYREIGVVIPPLVATLPEGLKVRIGAKTFGYPVLCASHLSSSGKDLQSLMNPTNMVTLCQRCVQRRKTPYKGLSPKA